MEIVSVGPVAGGPEALTRELERVASRIAGNKLGVMYLPAQCDHHAYLSAAGKGLRAPIVGATTGGAAFTERGVTRDEPVVAVLGGAGFDCSVAIADRLSEDPRQRVAAATERLVGAARKSISRSVSVLVLSDAFACDGDLLLSALQASTPPHWRFFGGTAGDDFAFENTYVFSNGELLTDAAVMVAIFGDQAASIAARHGFCAAGGRDLTITGIRGNELQRLDDQPAAEVYRAELQRLGLMSESDDLMQTMAVYALGARTLHGNELCIRTPIGVTPHGGIKLASSLTAGTVVRVVSADADQLIDSASELSSRALAPLAGGAVRGALIFDCAARLRLLGDRYSEHVAAFFGGRNFPCVGMAGYGEIARFGGSVEGFHNATAVMAAW